MEYTKNSKIELNIIDITKDGLGIAKYDEKVFFVKNALIGDVVDATITKVNKNVIYAKTDNIIKKSNFRVDDLCNVSKRCGGCQFLSLDYKQQLDIKKNYVVNCLKKIGKFEFLPYDSIIGMDYPYYYRNKMQVPFSIKNNTIVYGFYANRTHDIVEFDVCKVGFKNSNIVLDIIKDALNKYEISIYNEKTKTGIFREVLMRHANNTNNVSLTYVLNDKNYKKHINIYKKFDDYIVNNLNSNLPNENIDIVTSTLNINTLNNNVILSNNNVTLRGCGYIEDYIKTTKYHISPESFYQINMKMTEKLYDKIVDFGNFNNENVVLDLYCGIGTISIYIANVIKYVIGVECVNKAIENANANLALNNLKNATFICSDVNETLYNNICDILVKKEKYIGQKNIDTIIVDPPRKGLDKSAIKLIHMFSSKQIIYVSCDPATLARDLYILCNGEVTKSYEIVKVSNVDMFPHTMHIETIVLLQKKEN